MHTVQIMWNCEKQDMMTHVYILAYFYTIYMFKT